MESELNIFEFFLEISRLVRDFLFMTLLELNTQKIDGFSEEKWSILPTKSRNYLYKIAYFGFLTYFYFRGCIKITYIRYYYLYHQESFSAFFVVEIEADKKVWCNERTIQLLLFCALCSSVSLISVKFL